MRSDTVHRPTGYLSSLWGRPGILNTDIRSRDYVHGSTAQVVTVKDFVKRGLQRGNIYRVYRVDYHAQRVISSQVDLILIKGKVIITRLNCLI